MERTSIDVIEDVLGASLVPPDWTARSIAEIDTSDPAYAVPAISEPQYREIQRRLQDHWDAAWKFPDDQKDFLLVCPRVMTILHQYLSLIDIGLQERLRRDKPSWRIMVQPQIRLDDAIIARKALLYSKGVILRDPAELLASRVDDARWQEHWKAAFCYLGHCQSWCTLGLCGFIQLAPFSSDWLRAVPSSRPSSNRGRRRNYARSTRRRIGGRSCGGCLSRT